MRRLRKVVRWLWRHRKPILYLILIELFIEWLFTAPTHIVIDRLTAIVILCALYFWWKYKYRKNSSSHRRLGYIPRKRKRGRY